MKDETPTARTTCSRASSWRPFSETWGREREPLSSLPGRPPSQEDRSPLWDGPFLETVPGHRPRPTYQLDGTIQARGHGGCPGQLAEVRGPPYVERLLQVEDGVRHLGGGAAG